MTKARSSAKDYTAKYGYRLDVLLAGGEAAQFRRSAFRGFEFLSNALSIVSPSNREAQRGLVTAENQIGASQLALQTANKHPGLMNGQEYRPIVGTRSFDPGALGSAGTRVRNHALRPNRSP